jgi:protein RecA
MSLAEQMAAALAKGGVKSDEAKTYGLRLSTGVPNIDHMICGKYRGGGFQSGRIVEISGPSSSGKTLLAQHVMKEAQLHGGAAAFHDHERTFDQDLFASFGGSIEPGIFTYKRPDTFEGSIDASIDWMSTLRNANVIPFESPLVCVFDSFAAMVPAEKMERGEGAMNMREKVALATASSQELPAFANFVENNNILAIFLNQIRTKPGVAYGDPRYTPGGDSLPYYCSVRIWLARQMERDKKTREVTGQNITAETVKNKTHRPFLKEEFVFKFKQDGTGYIDVVASMVEHIGAEALTALGIQGGAWFTWEGQRIQGKDNFLAHLNANEKASVERLIDIAEALEAQRNAPVVPAAAA